MKYLMILVGVVCLSLPACAPAPEPEPEAAPEPVFDQAAEEAAVRKASKQGTAAWNKQDIETISALTDEHIESWRGTLKGKSAWLKNASQTFESQKDGQWKQTEDIGIIFITPDVAIYKARYETSGFVDENGNPEPPSKNLVAGVWVKKNGKWLQSAWLSRPEE